MNKTVFVLSFLSICLALGVTLFGLNAIKQPSVSGTWTHEQQRALAGKLKGAGLTLEAVKEYEDYLRTAPLDKKQLANLSYAIGKMYMEEGQYEKALSLFYRVELADPDTDLKTELGLKIINCLERTGKYNAAEYALNKRTSNREEKKEKTGRVAAIIGDEKIYVEDVTSSFDAMPEWMRKQVSTKEGKAEYLKKYVADELFFRKGIKLEYDKSPELRKRLARVEKELVVNKVLKEEIKDKIKVEDDDLKNFFEAHKNKYVQKEAVKVSLIKAGMKEIAEKIAEELKAGKTFEAMAEEVSLDKQTAANKGKFKNWVRQGEDDLGIGSVDKVSKVLFSAEKGEIISSIEVDGYFYLFRIEEKRSEKVPPFEDVKERVGNDYFMQKLQSNYQSLLEQILKSSEVKLFPEVFEGGSA
jgi:peptidyl-prolyl cis-trans isomerase C